ncbi:MAG TPA: aldo/keto reductase [Stellaceae bacterium]|nr:aldo/keto reductase [Stellaceae bacterium]
MIETIELAPGYRVSRLLKGGWQLSEGHSRTAQMADQAVADMTAFADAGITGFDCADIYTGVEALIGKFRERYRRERGAAALDRIKIHTKFVPDWSALGKLDRAHVEATIDRSRQRLGQDRLDLVQFHWWNYQAPGLVETGQWLTELQRAGKIAQLGGTNFDTRHTAALLDSGMNLVSMQVQYSLLDARPEHGLVALAARHGIGLLCYGALAGGFLGERWLGEAEPQGPFENRSLTKYRLIIDEFGGWDLFQTLLRTLQRIADKHSVKIGAVAIRHVLDRPQVAGVIVGARSARHLADTITANRLRLDADDKAALAAVLAERKGPAGDTFELERDRDGKHGRIMKYDLNTIPA